MIKYTKVIFCNETIRGDDDLTPQRSIITISDEAGNKIAEYDRYNFTIEEIAWIYDNSCSLSITLRGVIDKLIGLRDMQERYNSATKKSKALIAVITLSDEQKDELFAKNTSEEFDKWWIEFMLQQKYMVSEVFSSKQLAYITDAGEEKFSNHFEIAYSII